MAELENNRIEVSGPPDHSLVLVAVLPSPRDMEIARVLGWYRIPYKYAPKIVQVDYLAFYQPASFGRHQANRISVIAPVRGVELTTRLELFRDEPNHPRAKEEYYKIQIGTLQTLREPIMAGKWKRITFLYTTGMHLRIARHIKDLVIRDEERKIVWRTLRERQQLFVANSNDEDLANIDQEILMFLGNMHAFSDNAEFFIDY